MLVIAIIAAIFYGLAKKENMNLWLWPVIGVASYFIGQFVVGFIIGVIAPQMLYETGSVIIVALISGVISTGIVYLIMRQQIKKKKETVDQSELLDDNL